MLKLFGNKNRRIFLDYASATPVDPEVRESMKVYETQVFGNPSSIHTEGREARAAVESSRSAIAHFLNAQSKEVFFVSGGTEANNLAILGYFKKIEQDGKTLDGLHAVCSAVEHSSVRNCFEELSKKGLAVSYLNILPDGGVDLEELKKILRPETAFVSIMLVNNEIGTIQPLREISKILNHYSKKIGKERAVLHTDAVQAPLYIEIDVSLLGVDLMTLDGGKMYGPKGIGVLYKNNRVHIHPILHGGQQEKSLRPGTLNVPAVVGLARACQLAARKRVIEVERLSKMRETFLDKVKNKYPDVRLHGSLQNRIANNINLFIPNLESEFAVIALDRLGIAVSSESACLLEGPRGSYVISALSKEGEQGSSLRITMGFPTTKDDLEKLLDCLGKVMELRL